jgi:hypothetical protein
MLQPSPGSIESAAKASAVAMPIKERLRFAFSPLWPPIATVAVSRQERLLYSERLFIRHSLGVQNP